MSVFGRLVRALTGGGGGQKDDAAGRSAFWIYVRCGQCGERIRTRVSREHDLSAEFEGGDFPSAYYVHKEIVGSRCFRRIKVDLSFDGRRQLSEQKIEGGTFITREEYDAPADEPPT
jgi:hypothetical protein